MSGGAPQGPQSTSVPSVATPAEQTPRYFYWFALISISLGLLAESIYMVVVMNTAEGDVTAVNGTAFFGALFGIIGIAIAHLGGRRPPSIVQRVINLPEDFPFPATDLPPEIEEVITDRGKDYLGDYFKGLSAVIYSQALQIADGHGRDEIQTRDIAQACAEIAPGGPFPEQQTFWERIGSSITGVTIISAILAIIFGIIGAVGLVTDTNAIQPFLDIAQIFAGAVVGSTGAIAASNR